MTDKSFYLTEPYLNAKRKAEADLANWPDQRTENRGVLAIICLGLAVSFVIIWMGTYYARSLAHNNTPSQTFVHKSNGL